MAKLSVVETPAPSALSTLAADFLADRRASGLSLRTIEAYEFPLTRQFLPWCATEGITGPSQLTDQLAGRFTTHLLEDGGKHGQLSRATVRSYVRNLRVFLTWAGKADGGAATVGAKPKLPRPEKRMLDVLTRAEIQQMEDAAPSERDKLLLRMLADTGVRLGELLGIKVEDILEPRKGEYALKVSGKGSRDRLVPLPPALQRRLRRYLAGRRAEGRDWVFVGLRRSSAGRYEQLSARAAQGTVKGAAHRAGVEKRVYPHLLRHSYATSWLRSGGSLISLRNILGHADLSQIQSAYEHLDPSDDYQAAMKVLLGKE